MDDERGAERRVVPRATVETQIRLYYPDLRRLADEICRDISIGGMFVESNAPPEVGTSIRFELYLPTRPPRVASGEGSVVWRRVATDDPKRQAGFGVQFHELDPSFRATIFRVVDRFIQGGGDPFDLGA